MTGQIGVLNVGAGDNKLVFDPADPAGMIRAARIVTDMLRRGYALLIEVDDGEGGKKTTRVKEFREDTCEYIIADFDPVHAAQVETQETEHEQISRPPAPPAPAGATPGKGRRGQKVRGVSAAKTSGVAVGRIAGG
jgi:hypothetical protein